MRALLAMLVLSSVLPSEQASAQFLDITKFIGGKIATLPSLVGQSGIDYMLPLPSLPKTNGDLAQELPSPPPVGGAPPPPSFGVPNGAAIYLMNSGTANLSVAFVTAANQICAEVTIQADATQMLLPCGQYLAWNDSKSTQAMRVTGGHAYQIYWIDNSWGIKDVSEGMFGSN